MKNLSKRRQSRELALQVLFQREFHTEIEVSSSLQYFYNQFEPSPEVLAFAKTLVVGTIENIAIIDEKIKSYAQNWDITRMALVDKNILRIGVFELLFNSEETPYKSVINEALEISKKYSSQEASHFINGILDQIHKDA